MRHARNTTVPSARETARRAGDRRRIDGGDGVADRASLRIDRDSAGTRRLRELHPLRHVTRRCPREGESPATSSHDLRERKRPFRDVFAYTG